MKLLFIIPCMRGGGAERQLTLLVSSLTRYQNFKCELIVLSKDVFYTEIEKLPIRIHYLERKTKKDINIFFKILEIYKLFNPDIVHSWGWMTSFYMIPLKIFKGAYLIDGSIRIAPDRNTIPLSRKILNLINFHFADKIISNSKAGLISYKSPKDKSMVIYNGFDFNRVVNLKSSNEIKEQLGIRDQTIIGMVANFTERKDYDTFISAANVILKKRNDCKFIAIGDGPTLNKCKTMVNDYDINNNFMFLGKCKNVEDYENIFDIGVLASHSGEGISNSIMEYMVLKKPVITTPVGGSPELVVNNKTGLLVEPKNVKELVSGIEFLIEKPDVRKQMGKRGLERIRNEFTTARMFENYIQLYKNSKIETGLVSVI